MAIENSTAPCPDCGETDEGHATPCGNRRILPGSFRSAVRPPQVANRQPPRAFDRLHAVGEAFTHALLRCSERDLADTCVIGLRLNDELRKRGLVIRDGIKE
jgi:hypothetical protein